MNQPMVDSTRGRPKGSTGGEARLRRSEGQNLALCSSKGSIAIVLTPPSATSASGNEKSSRRAFPNWRWLCRLSLIEPAVATAWYLALARAFGVPAPFNRGLLLFASLWLVYMADRMLDVKRLPRADVPRTERHSFVFAQPRLVAGLWGIVCAVAFSAAMVALDLTEWVGCAIVLASTVVYFALVHRDGRTPLRLRERGMKELGVAIIFTAGSSLFIWSSSSFDRAVVDQKVFAVALLELFLLVLLNLLYLARRERHIDAAHNTPSAAWGVAGSTRADRFLVGLLSTIALANFALCAQARDELGVGSAKLLLPLSIGAAMGSLLLLCSGRLCPSRDDDAQHLFADLAVLVGALPALFDAVRD